VIVLAAGRDPGNVGSTLPLLSLALSLHGSPHSDAGRRTAESTRSAHPAVSWRYPDYAQGPREVEKNGDSSYAIKRLTMRLARPQFPLGRRSQRIIRRWSAVTVCVTLGYLAAYEARAAGPCNSDDFRIAIDVGHDGRRWGATSARGLPEYGFNREFGRRLSARLAVSGFPLTMLLESSDAPVTLEERVARASAATAAVLISIHHDSVQPHYLQTWVVEGRRLLYSDKFRGYSLFYSEKNRYPVQSRTFALAIATELRQSNFTPTLHHAEDIPGERRKLFDPVLGVYQYDDLKILKLAAMPAILFERGIIVNRTEEEELSTEQNPALLAGGVVRGVRSYCQQPIQ